MSKALELADRLEKFTASGLWYDGKPAAAELRRLAAVEVSQAELLEALQNLIEAAESMKGTYTFVQGKTPEHEDHYGHEKWAEEFLQETTDAARTAIAKATGETR